MKTLLSTTLILFTWTFCLGQDKPDRQQFEIDANNLKRLHLYNLHGYVEVEGTNTEKILVTVKRQLSSKKQALLNEGRSEIYFDTLTRGSDIYFAMKHPHIEFTIYEDGYGHYNSRYNGNWNKYESAEYRFDITVEFPKRMNLTVSNHHDGLSIEEVDGDLYAETHHKNLYAKGIGGNASFDSHHGKIEASFTRNPTKECYFRTHHGDIRITYLDPFSADVKLESRHGEFFTDFDWEPKTMQITRESSSKGTKYKVGDGTHIVINQGGPLQSFSTRHGNIYLLKN